MIEAIKKEYELPPVLLTQILSSNPSAAKSERVQRELNDRLMPLDEWQRQQIDAGLAILSQKELLEEEMSNALGERWDAVNKQIAEIYADDNISDKVVAVTDILDPLQFFSDRQLFIELLKGNGQIEEAISSLESIPIDFKTDETMLLELGRISEIWSMEQSLVISGDESVLLNETQVETLKEILFTGGSWASGEALAVLQAYSDFNYIEPLMESCELENRSLQTQFVSEFQLFNLYPNPTSEFCTLERINATGICNITLSDVTGRTVQRLTMKDEQQQAIVTFSELASGTYLMRLTTEWNTVLWTTSVVKQ